jgi:hypothetical protein
VLERVREHVLGAIKLCRDGYEDGPVAFQSVNGSSVSTVASLLPDADLARLAAGSWFVPLHADRPVRGESPAPPARGRPARPSAVLLRRVPPRRLAGLQDEEQEA